MQSISTIGLDIAKFRSSKYTALMQRAKWSYAVS